MRQTLNFRPNRCCHAGDPIRTRIVFLDYLRVIACLMVIVIHSTEPYYLGAEGLSVASYGTYLVHLAILLMLSGWLKPLLPTPVGILSVAVSSFVLASAVSLALGRMQKVGKWICG